MRYVFVAVLGVFAAACSVLDNDLDEIEFRGDGSDGDSDADGDACTVMILDTLEMEGVCQAASVECEGGKYPMDPEGDCAEGDCCLGTDQCERYPLVLSCSDTECADEGGGPFGCPAGGWCCPIL